MSTPPYEIRDFMKHGLRKYLASEAVAPTLLNDRMRHLDRRLGGGAGVPRKFLDAFDGVRWSAFVQESTDLIVNTLGFAHRERSAPSSGD